MGMFDTIFVESKLGHDYSILCEKFNGYVDNEKARKRIQKKAIEKCRKNTGQWQVPDNGIERVTVNYLRHYQAGHEQYLTRQECENE